MKLIKADDSLVFDDGTEVFDYHCQSCCEEVYADFSQLKDKVGQDFHNLKIEKVEGSGFRIGGEFVPCYNIQNGYYGDDLEITIKRPNGTEQTFDISDCTDC